MAIDMCSNPMCKDHPGQVKLVDDSQIEQMKLALKYIKEHTTNKEIIEMCEEFL